MIKNHSKQLSPDAIKELKAVEGVPGQPGVRLFQQGVPAAGGARPRDRPAMIAHFDTLWRSSVESGHIPLAAATGSRPPRAQRN